MLDTLLEIGSAFDWISPIAGLVGDIANGPSYTFLIPYDCGISGREISRLLKRRGVDSWGHMVVDGSLMITVRQGQARWAQHLLDQAGVPVDNPLAGHKARRRSSAPHANRSERSDGTGAALRDILDLRIF